MIGGLLFAQLGDSEAEPEAICYVYLRTTQTRLNRLQMFYFGHLARTTGTYGTYTLFLLGYTVYLCATYALLLVDVHCWILCFLLNCTLPW